MSTICLHNYKELKHGYRTYFSHLCLENVFFLHCFVHCLIRFNAELKFVFQRQELFRADATDDQLVTCQKECTCDREKDEINKLQMVIKNQPACEMEYFKQHVTMLVSKLLRARLVGTCLI